MCHAVKTKAYMRGATATTAPLYLWLGQWGKPQLAGLCQALSLLESATSKGVLVRRLAKAAQQRQLTIDNLGRLMPTSGSTSAQIDVGAIG